MNGKSKLGGEGNDNSFGGEFKFEVLSPLIELKHSWDELIENRFLD